MTNCLFENLFLVQRTAVTAGAAAQICGGKSLMNQFRTYEHKHESMDQNKAHQKMIMFIQFCTPT